MILRKQPKMQCIILNLGIVVARNYKSARELELKIRKYSKTIIGTIRVLSNLFTTKPLSLAS